MCLSVLLEVYMIFCEDQQHTFQEKYKWSKNQN